MVILYLSCTINNFLRLFAKELEGSDGERRSVPDKRGVFSMYRYIKLKIRGKARF